MVAMVSTWFSRVSVFVSVPVPVLFPVVGRGAGGGGGVLPSLVAGVAYRPIACFMRSSAIAKLMSYREPAALVESGFDEGSDGTVATVLVWVKGWRWVR